MTKKIIAAVTASVMAFTAEIAVFPYGTFFANAEDKITGETPNGFTYEIEDDRVSITGWTGDKESVTSLIIPSEAGGMTVNAIGSGAFEDMPLLTSISIPESVTYIGWGAFSNTGLTSIDLPDGIQELSYRVFEDCESLKELTIPKGFPKNGMSCSNFYGVGTISTLSDSCIETLIFEDGLEAIPDYCAYNAPELKNLVIPSSVTTIGYEAFIYDDALTSLELPSTIRIIENEAFYDCDGLTDVVIPEGVEEIWSSAFGKCDNLTSFVFPSTLKKISNYMFTDCKSLTSVTIPEGVEVLNVRIFEGCENLKEITIPTTVNEVWSPLDKSYIETVNIADGTEAIANGLCSWTEHVTTINIPDSVTSLGSRLFGSATGIKEFTVPAQITYADSVFSGSSLETIHFEPGLTKIPDRLCSGAEKLVNIDWTSDITEIGERAFIECKGLVTADIPDTVTTIGASAFCYCESLKNLHIPENGCQIGTYLFSGCTSLQEAYVPAGITAIENNDTAYLFNGCTSLQKITFADGITEIPSCCCAYCDLLTEIVFPETLEKIGYISFKYCPNLEKVNIPDSVTVIGNGAFAFDESLHDVELPPNLEEIDAYAFEGCSALTEITIPKSVTTIDNNAFNCGLREVWFEDGTVTIPEHACLNAKQLETAHIPASVTTFGESAFSGCYSLKTLDMPFEPGYLLPNENFARYTFNECYSLFDERVIPYDASGTFVNRIESTTGEGGIINYTVYFSLNPVFKDIYKNGNIQVCTKDSNPIVARSLPVGLREDELEQYFYRTNYTIPDGTEMGVFRFSTEPKANADTTVEVTLEVYYTNGYKTYWKTIPVNNDSKGWEPVTLTVPARTGVKDGTAEFSVFGSASPDSDVTIYLNGEPAATATPNPYTGRFSATVTAPADYGDTLRLYAQSGDTKSAEQSVECSFSVVDVEKVVLYHNNAHTAYELDITGAFKYGERPYLAYNPNRPVGFEVTLSDNDCSQVGISSTTNGNTSIIYLEYSEATGTWKGEGYFDTRIPGELNVLAVPKEQDMELTVSTDDDGNTSIATEGGKQVFGDIVSSQSDAVTQAFLDAYPMQVEVNNENMLAVRFVANNGNITPALSKPSKLALLSNASNKRNGSESTELPSINVVTATLPELTIDGTTYTGNDMINAADTFRLERSPFKIVMDENSIYEVYVMPIDDESLGLADKIALNLSLGAESASEYLESCGNKMKEGCITLYRDVKTGATQICVQVFSASLEFILGQATDLSVSGIIEWASKKALEGAASVGSVVAYLFNVIKTGWDLYHKGIDINDIWEQINFSKNPEVQKQALKLKALLCGSFLARVMVAAAVLVVGFIVLLEALTVGVPLLVGLLIGLVVGIIALIANSMLDWVDNRLRKEAYAATPPANLNTLIDPSGIAYEFLPSNPIEGVTAQIYYQDESGNAVLWNAGDYDQLNPQITDSSGWFAWDVPEGMWQVRLSADGYDDAQSEWLPVLPVQVGININMTSKLPAVIKDAGSCGNTAMVTFSKHMLDATVTSDSLCLTDSDGNIIPAEVKAIKEEGNSTNASMTFTLTAAPGTDLTSAQVNVTADALSYAGTACAAQTSALRVLEAGEIPEPKDNKNLGDVNGDGLIDSVDSSMILVHNAGATQGEQFLTDEQLSRSDINGDGMVDSVDASLILVFNAEKAENAALTMSDFIAELNAA